GRVCAGNPGSLFGTLEGHRHGLHCRWHCRLQWEWAVSKRRTYMNRLNVNGFVRFGMMIASVILINSAALTHLSAQCVNSCPPYSPPTGPNLLKNPDFDVVGP